MSYPAQPPLIAATPPPSPPGRPPAVSVAAALLWLMAGVGLIYAIATLAVVPGTVSRFRGVTGGGPGFSGDNDPEYYVAVVWLGAAIALALAVIAFALFVVIGLSLRRGSNVARIAALVVCILGVLGGVASILTVAAQRSGDTTPSSLGGQLSEAYPGGWVGTNVSLSVAQILGYAVVGILVLTAPRAFFRRPVAPLVPQQAYGMPYPGYGEAAHAPGAHQAPVGYPTSGVAQAAPGVAQPAPGVAQLGPGAAQLGPGVAQPFPGVAQPAAGYPGVGYPAAHPGGVPAPGGYPGAWDPAVPSRPGGYPPAPGAEHPGAGYPPPAGYAGYAPGSNSPANRAENFPPPGAAPDHSPYARPPGHAPDAPFAFSPPVAPAQTQNPAADPHSPYARPRATTPVGPSEGLPTATPMGQSEGLPADVPGPQDAPKDVSRPATSVSEDGASDAAGRPVADRPTPGAVGGSEAQPPTAS